MIWVVRDVNKAPHSNVELTFFVKQRSFDVFLNYPLGVLGLFINIVDDVSYLREQLDAFSLVQICRFQDPLVVFTMLFRHTFIQA